MDDRSNFQKRNDKVYVSNIDYGCTHQDIKDLFQEVGNVAFVEMLKDGNKLNGCAVVRFKENDMVDKAIRELNRHEYKGRKLVVKDYQDMTPLSTAVSDRSSKMRKRPRDDFYDSISLMESASKKGNTYGLSVKFLESLGIDGPLNSRVFVANLPYDASEEDIKELFTICGKVEDVELVHSDDGKSKGFGFIEFEHPIEAVQAISMLHNQPYHDRKLSVQYTQKEKRQRNSGPKLPAGLKSLGLGLGLNGAPLKDIARTIEAGQQQSLLGAVPLNSASIAPIGLGMSLSSSLNRGFSNNLGQDLQRDTSQLLGSNLREKLLAGAGLLNTPGLQFGNNRNMQEPPNIHLGSSLMGQRNCVEVSNLPPDYTWKALYDLCQSFGDVSFAKISGRGIGIVHFENSTAGRRAIDMLDHQEFEGRYLQAKFM